jgi:ribosomal protein S18 acetylase RimI-like enzyme
MDEFVWEQTDAPAPADAAAVNDGLDASNRAAADWSAVRPLACFARLPLGELVGGAVARTWGGCCELRQVWVDPAYRRRGVGRHLVELIEAAARARRCTLLFLETFSFQAPELYRALGFETVCELGGFPGGVTKYIMRKSLIERQACAG